MLVNSCQFWGIKRRNSLTTSATRTSPLPPISTISKSPNAKPCQILALSSEGTGECKSFREDENIKKWEKEKVWLNNLRHEKPNASLIWKLINWNPKNKLLRILPKNKLINLSKGYETEDQRVSEGMKVGHVTAGGDVPVFHSGSPSLCPSVSLVCLPVTLSVSPSLSFCLSHPLPPSLCICLSLSLSV